MATSLLLSDAEFLRNAGALLTALQFGDGQFPGGGFAFSWGLESLAADGKVSRMGFADFLAGQLRHRWGNCDRVILVHSHAASHNLARLLELDDLTDAWLTAAPLRTGSRRAGAALLGTHLRLGTPGAQILKDALDRGDACGHLPVVQGVTLAGVGLDARAAIAVSAYGVAQSLCTAAIRLGLISHLDAQRALSGIRPCLAQITADPVPAPEDIHSFTPVADIAAMRHTDQAQRLFSN
jgi:urease accessory protein